MDVQKIAVQFRLNEWAELVRERASSGQSVKAFCNENGISESTYYHRLRRVRLAACTEIIERQRSEPQAINWAQVTEMPTSVTSRETLTIEISGCKIEVTQNTDAELLAKTCRILRSIC